MFGEKPISNWRQHLGKEKQQLAKIWEVNIWELGNADFYYDVARDLGNKKKKPA